MAYTTPDDWLDRFKAAGMRMQVDEVGTMRPDGAGPLPEKERQLWSEIRGPGNEQRWAAVDAAVRLRMETISFWSYYP